MELNAFKGAIIMENVSPHQDQICAWLGAEAVARTNLPFLLALAIPRDQIIIVAS
jgi:hypothetical protein